MPERFFAIAEGQRAARIDVNWLGVKRGLAASFDALTKNRESEVPVEILSRARSFRTRNALFHVLEFLPEVIDAAIVNLYIEAFLLVPVERRRPYARWLMEKLSQRDYDTRIQRLGIQEGPKPRFQHRSEYENALKTAINALLERGSQISQETVAGEINAESPHSLDGRMIRKWNREFGVVWKPFIKKFKTDES